MLDNFNYVPQGWECPKCGRVYAPSTPMCWHCPIQSTTQTSLSNFLSDSTTLNVTGCEFEPLADGTTTNSSDICAKCGRHKVQHVKLTNL